MLLLRALVAPLILTATVVLSFAAALGVSAFFFNHVFGFGGADTSFPLFVFVFLVALGIDYNIFLMTRVREEAIKRDARHGAIIGLAATGGVITSAGFVLAGTFAVLATIPSTVLTEIGFAVAFGQWQPLRTIPPNGCRGVSRHQPVRRGPKILSARVLASRAAACHPGSGSAGRNYDKAARNPDRTVGGGREARGPPPYVACSLPASGRHDPADHRWACPRRSACGYRRHSCQICGCKRCCRERRRAFRPGGPGAGWGGARALRGRGRRRIPCHVALSPVPAAGRPGGGCRGGERHCDRDRLSRGR